MATSQNAVLPYSRQALIQKFGLWRLDQQIIVSGKTGRGCTSVVEALSELFPARTRIVSVGQIYRDEANARHMVIDEFSAYQAEHPEDRYDEIVDGEVAVIGKQNRVIFDSRIAHLFALFGFRANLVCPPEFAGPRRARDKRNLGTITSDEEEIQKIICRDAHDDGKYDKLYPGWRWTTADFDIEVDTRASNAEETAARIFDGYRSWLSSYPVEYLIREPEVPPALIAHITGTDIIPWFFKRSGAASALQA